MTTIMLKADFEILLIKLIRFLTLHSAFIKIGKRRMIVRMQRDLEGK